MTNSKGSVVVVAMRERTGATSQRWLCQMAAVMARMRWIARVTAPPWVCPRVAPSRTALQGVVDGLDDPPEWLREPCAGSRRFTCFGGADQGGAAFDPEGFGLRRGVALVGQDHLTGADEIELDLDEVSDDLMLVSLGVGQGEGDRQARRRAHQVEPEPPEVARMAGEVGCRGIASGIAWSCIQLIWRVAVK